VISDYHGMWVTSILPVGAEDFVAVGPKWELGDNGVPHNSFWFAHFTGVEDDPVWSLDWDLPGEQEQTRTALLVEGDTIFAPGWCWAPYLSSPPYEWGCAVSVSTGGEPLALYEYSHADDFEFWWGSPTPDGNMLVAGTLWSEAGATATLTKLEPSSGVIEWELVAPPPSGSQYVLKDAVVLGSGNILGVGEVWKWGDRNILILGFSPDGELVLADEVGSLGPLEVGLRVRRLQDGSALVLGQAKGGGAIGDEVAWWVRKYDGDFQEIWTASLLPAVQMPPLYPANLNGPFAAIEVDWGYILAGPCAVDSDWVRNGCVVGLGSDGQALWTLSLVGTDCDSKIGGFLSIGLRPDGSILVGGIRDADSSFAEAAGAGWVVLLSPPQAKCKGGD